MANARCPGCGAEESTSKRINAHLRQCQDYAAVYRSGQELPDPVECYRRAHPAPETKPRSRRAEGPKVSDPDGAVAPEPSGAVAVEHWSFPHTLLDEVREVR